MQMRQAAIERFKLDEANVYYLSEKPDLAPDVIHGPSRKEQVLKVFEELSQKVQPGDQLFVLLIGHGSYRSEQSRFSMPGPDLTAVDFHAILKPFADQQVVFVNAASASGSFLPVLSGANRVIVTATKTGFERNETQFGKYFIEAYSGDGADTDKNGRVSVLEAFDYAHTRVAEFYDSEQRLKTEHALLDDNGDGEGVMKVASAGSPIEDGGDGLVAGGAYLLGSAAALSGDSGEFVSDSPEVARLLEDKQALEVRVADLRRQKDSMPEEIYLEELEKLLLQLAHTSAQIDALRQGKPNE